jgi:hypothetical protein
LSEPEPGAVGVPPVEIQIIAVLQLLGALVNMMLGSTWLFYGLGFGSITCCFGCVFGAPMFLMFPLAVFEAVSAVQLLAGHREADRVRWVALAELLAIFACSPLPLLTTPITLMLLKRPEVMRWFGEDPEAYDPQ